METNTLKPQIDISKGKDPVTGRETARAHVKVGEYHLSIVPDSATGQYEVVVWPDDGKGGMSVSADGELFFTRVDATAGDVEEIADTYKRRLESGINPRDLDKDEQEQRTAFLESFDPGEARE